jgi:3-oxoacyl-[acyl-carrier-protein] synthase II
MTGHLLGAAGGIESIFTTLAVYHQVSPPTINIFNQDPECDLDYCANEARPMRIDTAISNSFQMGRDLRPHHSGAQHRHFANDESAHDFS